MSPRGKGKAKAGARKGRAGYMISAVAEMFRVHPQTLRLYERQGLLKPSRSQGNTRLYTQQDLDRLDVILTLARDMGVNLAGIDVVLNMRDRMLEMEHQMQEFIQFVREELARRHAPSAERRSRSAMVRVGPPRVIRVSK